MGVGDCVFWSIICLVALTFVWLKFIEPFLSVWFVLPVGGILSVLIFIFGGGFGIRRKGERRKEGSGRCDS